MSPFLSKKNHDKDRVHTGVEQKQGKYICRFSWSVHHNFVRDGKYSERGWACGPPSHHHHQAGLIFFRHDGIYAGEWPLPICLYSVGTNRTQFLYNFEQLTEYGLDPNSRAVYIYSFKDVSTVPHNSSIFFALL